jgi:capsular exopolysaccharide synthesis family protein
MTFATARHFVRRWSVLLLLAPVVGGVIGVYVVGQLPPVFEATTTLLVTPGTGNSTSNSDELQSAVQLAQTYVEAIHTRPVLTEAAARIGLDVPYRALEARVQVRRVSNTQLLRISAQSASPSEATALANSVGDVFIAKNQDLQAKRYANSRESLSRLVDSLQADLESHAAQITNLRAQPETAERNAELVRVEGELTQIQTSHNATVRSYEDLRVTEARGLNTLAVLDPAVPPETPISPNRTLIVILAIAGAVAAALGVTWLVDSSADALQDRRRVSQAAGMVTLGTVPAVKGLRSTLRDPPRRLTESCRLLVSSLGAVLGSTRLVLVTSASSGEGKSTIAANLALTLAEVGQRVILVDADLRRPSLARLFDLSSADGLTELLGETGRSPTTVLRESWSANLKVMTAGKPPADSSRLLVSPRLNEVIHELLNLCDVVILDSPPLLGQTDALLLSSRGHGVLLVVDARRSRSRQVMQACEKLRDASASTLGVVVNRVPNEWGEYVAAEVVADGARTNGRPADAATPLNRLGRLELSDN